ncbi:biotin-dependent enzyme [Dokdonia sp. Hel_I_63]|uniref:acetyl-CoA carboxylase biotin carboxyl carrier protein subunit n=1 Tax=Dokdonia sp. Hel_I_63 TaxID=1249996 RepID=UPI00119ADE7D|nr:biotin/lipoyl-containing protein [Dokdonia sp. Hel_I_63]TVZ21886.1 biotin-dependent enzyme [Dokdonia sp. Hel_I_63]
MSNTYKTTVNEEHEFEVSRDQLSQLDAVNTSQNSHHILEDNSSFKATVVSSDFSKKTYNIQVNSNNYEVVIKDEIDILIKEMGFTVGGSKQLNNLISPMPGLIIDVQVSAGQEVKEGDTLVILSAMKMENSFVSHTDGVIKAVHVVKDDAVDKGQLLVEFEEEK